MMLSKKGKDVTNYLIECIGEQECIDIDDFGCWYEEAMEEYDYCEIQESEEELVNYLINTLNVTIE